MKANRYTEDQFIGVLREKLKKLLAELELDTAALKDLLGRKW